MLQLIFRIQFPLEKAEKIPSLCNLLHRSETFAAERLTMMQSFTPWSETEGMMTSDLRQQTESQVHCKLSA